MAVAALLSVDELVERNIGLVRSHANKMRDRTTMDYDDLVQEGMFALWEAAKGWRPDFISPKTGQPVRFSSYAMTAIARRMSAVTRKWQEWGTDSEAMHLAPGGEPVEDDPLEGVHGLPRLAVELLAGLHGPQLTARQAAAFLGVSVSVVERCRDEAARGIGA